MEQDTKAPRELAKHVVERVDIRGFQVQFILIRMKNSLMLTIMDYDAKLGLAAPTSNPTGDPASPFMEQLGDLKHMTDLSVAVGDVGSTVVASAESSISIGLAKYLSKKFSIPVYVSFTCTIPASNVIEREEYFKLLRLKLAELYSRLSDGASQ